MILSVTFSKPVSNIQDFFEHSYQKIKVNIQNSNGKTSYFAQMFTQTQVFHTAQTLSKTAILLKKMQAKLSKIV